MTQKIYFKNLDTLRFLAFLSVFLYHAFGHLAKKFQISLAIFGGIGVSVFFVLSGFLITFLLLQEKQNNFTINLKLFYLRRIYRTWPLYFLIITIGLLFYKILAPYFLESNTTDSNPLYFLFFLGNIDVINTQTIFNGNDSLVTNNTWSLAVEEQFYVFWPLVFIFLKSRIIPLIYVTAFALTVLFRLKHQNEPSVIYFHTFSVLFDLVIGGIAAHVILYSAKIKSFFEKMSKKKQITYFVILCFPILLGSVFPILKFNGVFGRYFYSFLFCYLILNQCFTKKPIFELHRFTVFSSLGKYSYGMYLWHTIVLSVTTFYCSQLPFSLTIQLLVSGMLSLLLTIFIGYISYMYFEKYFLEMKSRLKQ